MPYAKMVNLKPTMIMIIYQYNQSGTYLLTLMKIGCNRLGFGNFTKRMVHSKKRLMTKFIGNFIFILK